MSQVEQNEQPSEERIENHKREALENESLAAIEDNTDASTTYSESNVDETTGLGFIKIQDKPPIKGILPEAMYKQLLDILEYRNATEEEKVAHCATKMVLDVLKNDKNKISIQNQEMLLDRTTRQVRAERQNVFQTLNEAEEELKRLTWQSILPQSLTQVKVNNIGGHRSLSQTSARGMRGIYIVTFGNFALAKGNVWIYRPTQQQMFNSVNRFIKRASCEQAAYKLRLIMKSGGTLGSAGEPIESKNMKEFKKNLLDQINEIRATV